MSLATQISDFVVAVGTEFKADRATMGSLLALATTDRSSLVAAINELQSEIQTSGAQIDDVTASSTTVYSSTKTNTEIAAAVANLVASSPAALDTLDELAAALGDDANFATTTATALGNRLRFDAAQALTAPQMVQGNTNLGSLSLIESGDPETNFVTIFNAALV